MHGMAGLHSKNDEDISTQFVQFDRHSQVSHLLDDFYMYVCTFALVYRINLKSIIA